MNVLDSAQAESLIARNKAGEDLSDEELGDLADYFARNTPETPDAPEDSTDLAERGRHLRLALQYHELLDELFANRA